MDEEQLCKQNPGRRSSWVRQAVDCARPGSAVRLGCLAAGTVLLLLILCYGAVLSLQVRLNRLQPGSSHSSFDGLMYLSETG